MGISFTAGLGLDYAAYKFKARLKHSKVLPENKSLIEENMALNMTNKPKLDKSTLFFGVNLYFLRNHDKEFQF